MNFLELLLSVIGMLILYFVGIKVGRTQVENGLDFFGREKTE